MPSNKSHSFSGLGHATLLHDVGVVHHIGMAAVRPPPKNTLDSWKNCAERTLGPSRRDPDGTHIARDEFGETNNCPSSACNSTVSLEVSQHARSQQHLFEVRPLIGINHLDEVSTCENDGVVLPSPKIG